MGDETPKKSKTAATNLPSMREVSGPFDPFAETRNKYLESKDPMMLVCGWIARAWRESDAVEITGVDETEWIAWQVDNTEVVKTAKILGQALVYAEIRGIALGITSRRGQAASQKLLLEMLGAKDAPGKKNEAEKVIHGSLDPSKQQKSMKVFDEDRLKEMAGYPDDDLDDSEGRAS